MAWTVLAAPRARRSLERLPVRDRRRIQAALAAMAADPLAGDVVKLKGRDAFRRRVGDWRIIFDIDFAARAVRVFDVLRRNEATYR
jgi:mRNA interferase RelE/StbE